MTEDTRAHSTNDLQRSLCERSAEFDANPLLANGGRIMNILDPERYGWTNVRRAAERDGIVALTMVDQEKTLPRLETMFGEDAIFPFWQCLTGTPKDVLQACAGVLKDTPLPKGWQVESHARPSDELIQASQLLNESTGVAPSPAYYLRGDDVPSMLTCVHDANGEMAACASASMRYHRGGPLADWVFAGGVSVHSNHRRLGLGSLVNAALLAHSHKQYHWVCALEQAKAGNAPSLGMITRCGLNQDSAKITVVISLTGAYLTR